jgi:hypothetical protein
MSDCVKHYRSLDGRHYFTFRFVQTGDLIEIFVLAHPGFNGQDSDPNKSHLFSSGKLCFVAGRAPHDLSRAFELARQWGEYFCEYRQTGISQS